MDAATVQPQPCDNVSGTRTNDWANILLEDCEDIMGRGNFAENDLLYEFIDLEAGMASSKNNWECQLKDKDDFQPSHLEESNDVPVYVAKQSDELNGLQWRPDNDGQPYSVNTSVPCPNFESNYNSPHQSFDLENGVNLDEPVTQSFDLERITHNQLSDNPIKRRKTYAKEPSFAKKNRIRIKDLEANPIYSSENFQAKLQGLMDEEQLLVNKSRRTSGSQSAESRATASIFPPMTSPQQVVHDACNLPISSTKFGNIGEGTKTNFTTDSGYNPQSNLGMGEFIHNFPLWDLSDDVSGSEPQLFHPPQVLEEPDPTASSEIISVEGPTRKRGKIYHCTYPNCKQTFSSPGDWRRHEESEKHWLQQRYMCLECIKPSQTTDCLFDCPFCKISFSSIAGVKEHSLLCDAARKAAKSFTKKDHFRSHLRDVHELPGVTGNTTSWTFQIDSSWPRRCGFCGDHHKSWDDRAQHIVEHFKSGIKIDKWAQAFENTEQDLPDVSHTQSATEAVYTTEVVFRKRLQSCRLKETDPNMAIKSPSPNSWIALAPEQVVKEKQHRRSSSFDEDMPRTIQRYLQPEGEIHGIHTNVEPDERLAELSHYAWHEQSDASSFFSQHRRHSEGISDQNETLALDHRNTVPTSNPRISMNVRWQRLITNGRSRQHTKTKSQSRRNMAASELNYGPNGWSQAGQENDSEFSTEIASADISHRPRITLLSRTRQWTKSVLTKPKSWFGHTSRTQPNMQANHSSLATSTMEANAHFQSPLPSFNTFPHSNAPSPHSYNAEMSSPQDTDDLLLRINDMMI